MTKLLNGEPLSVDGADTISMLSGAFSAASELPLKNIAATAAINSPLYALAAIGSAKADYDSALASGNNDAIVSAYLGFAAAIGSFLASFPTPQTKGLGLVLNLGATALKTAWDNGWRPYDIDGNYTPPPSYPTVIQGSDYPGIPGDANNNGLPDILESIKQTYTDAKAITSPIILDLDGDGVETTAVGSGTWFDHDANGFAESTGWAGSDDGILVRDLDGNGTIDSGRELFGSETLLANGQKAANGFQALAELDSNLDGKIDASDAAYTTLNIWKDVDGDGTTDAGELLTLAEAGVQSLNVGYTASTAIDANGNQHQQISSYTTTTGATRAAEDVWFKVDKTNAIAENWVAVTADIAVLPDVTGYGNVYDLHQAMARDTANDDEWRVAV